MIPKEKEFRQWLCTPSDEGGYGIAEKSVSSYISNLTHLDKNYLTVVGMSLEKFANEVEVPYDSDLERSEVDIESLIRLLISLHSSNKTEKKRLQDARSAFNAYYSFLLITLGSKKGEKQHFTYSELSNIFKGRLRTQHREGVVPMRDFPSSCYDNARSERFRNLVEEMVKDINILTEEGIVKFKHIDWLEIRANGVFVYVNSIERELNVLTYVWPVGPTNTEPMIVDEISKVSLDHTPRVSDVISNNQGKFKVFGHNVSITSKNIDDALDDLKLLKELTTITLMRIDYNKKKRP